MSNILRQRLEAGQGNAEHPAADLLAAFVEHELKNGERDRVLAHLAGCPTCRQAVALAVPETISGSPGLVTHRPVLQFPAAMRWASLAAAVTVAVGVGVISYEHETGRSASPSIATSPQPEPRESQSQKPVTEAAAPALQDSLATKQSVIESKNATITDKKIIPSAAAKKTYDRQNLDETALARNKKQSSQSGVVARVVDGQSTEGIVGGIAGAEAFQQQVPVTGANLALTPTADKEKAASQNEIQAGKSAPAPVVLAAPAAPPVVSSAYADQSTQVVASPGPVNQSRDTDALLSQKGVASRQFSSVHSENVLTAPPKTAGLPAMTGAFRRPASAVNEMVSWTVTAAGKLQREVRNGAVKLIEPAPGLIVRAVAAHGIEVWAGGSQPDLSAKQWQQAPALFHSSDAGESWTQVAGPWHGSIHQVSLAGSEHLTVVTDDGTWISRDSGKNWSRP